jgi:hypothetical protein
MELSYMRMCCVLACDAGFFHQLQACIGTIEAARPALAGIEFDIAVVAIDLAEPQIASLKQKGAIVHDRLSEFPRFRGAPQHAYALTCRPFMTEFLPGYDGYLWVDSDIRFLHADGLRYYAEALRVEAASVILVQETEPCYTFNRDPKIARFFHATLAGRLAAVYGDEVAEYCRYFTPFNAGLFAARASSPIWARYRRNLHKALRVPFDNMLEQDALNVAIHETGGQLRAPSPLNWLCSLAFPNKRSDGTWCSPENWAQPILVAHLTNSTSIVASAQGSTTYYDLYRQAGLTA